MAIYPFRYWCYKILPLVYDDSLSYYELLCKLVAKLNECIEAINTAPENVSQIVTEIMNGWLEDGTISTITEPFVEPAVLEILTQWSEDGTLENIVAGDVENIVNEILQEWAEDGTIAGLLKHYHADSHYYVYVDCNNGSDANDGITRDTPLKTLDKALDKMAQYGAGVYIYLIASGTYRINYPTIHAASIHLMYDADNITVYWGAEGNSSTKKLYDTYLHLGGKENGNSIFYSAGTGEAGVEPGKIFARNIIFDGDLGSRFACYGGSVQLISCTIRIDFRIGVSTAVFQDCILDANIPHISDSYAHLIHAYNGSTICFRGTLSFVPKTDYGNMNGNSWIFLSYATVFMSSNFTVNGADTVAKVFGGDCASFIGPWTAINNNINGNYTTLDNCVFNGVPSRGNNVKASRRFETNNFSQYVAAGSYADVNISFEYEYQSAPIILTQITSAVADTDMSDITVQIVSSSITTTGATLRIVNGSDTGRTPNVRWVAFHL